MAPVSTICDEYCSNDGKGLVRTEKDSKDRKGLVRTEKD